MRSGFAAFLLFLGVLGGALGAALGGAPAASAQSGGGPASFEAALEEARGQSVYWNAWGGDDGINAYIAWAGERVAALYGIELQHVKLSDTADAVARVLAEKTAGRNEGGTIDLIWINGENFAAMKRGGLLHGPFTQLLPNFALIDTADKPTTVIDFTVPTEGLEAPWGMAKFNIIYDSARVAETPGSIAALKDWAAANPGRFTYPAPPDFLGSTFLKQALSELAADPAVLQAPPESAAAFAEVTRPLWDYLDALHPLLWRGGELFPAGGPAQIQLLDDGELDMALSFNPGQASALIAQERLPESARTFVFTGGTIANTHFLAIPFNAANKAAALVLANFLMSPEAQARKQDPEIWGDGTVLSLERLSAEERALFEALPRGPATLPPDRLGPALPEPHPDWMSELEKAWQARYAK